MFLLTNSKSIVILLFLFMLSGCAGLQPMSNFARSGDTITVALLGAEADEFISKSNLTAEIVDASGSYPISIRYLMRAYPDPVSIRSWYERNDQQYQSALGGQGLWIAVIDLVDPNTNSAPPLVAGGSMATINFNYSGMDDLNIPSQTITILDGQGESHSLLNANNNYEMVFTLEPEDHIQVSFDGELPESPYLGAVKVTFSCDVGSICVSSHGWSAVQVNPNPHVQLFQSVYTAGEPGTEVRYLDVYIVNPYGFKEVASGSFGEGRKKDLSFSIMWASNQFNITQNNWSDYLTVEATYYDLDGNEINTLSPNIRVVRN